MQRIIVFLGLLLIAGSVGVAAHWPAAQGPTIPRSDLSTATVASGATATPAYVPPKHFATTSAPTPAPSYTSLASPTLITPTPTPSASASPSPPSGCGTCGGHPNPGAIWPHACVNPHSI